MFSGLRLRRGDEGFTTLHSQLECVRPASLTEWVALAGQGACLCSEILLRVLLGVPDGVEGGRSAVSAQTLFAHQVEIWLPELCVM